MLGKLFGFITATMDGLGNQKPVLFNDETGYDTILLHRHKVVAELAELNEGEFAKADGVSRREFANLLLSMSSKDRGKLDSVMHDKIAEGVRFVPIKVTVQKRFGLIVRTLRHGLVLSEIHPKGAEDKPLDVNDFNLLRLADSTERR
jgi:hypothetical protein